MLGLVNQNGREYEKKTDIKIITINNPSYWVIINYGNQCKSAQPEHFRIETTDNLPHKPQSRK